MKISDTCTEEVNDCDVAIKKQRKNLKHNQALEVELRSST